MDSNIFSYKINKDGPFPNNEKWPLLIYKGHLKNKTAEEIEEILQKNDWTNGWRDAIYDFHHYHSNTHEVLCVYQGHAKVQFGGPNGLILEIEKGDVIIIPVGLSHKCIHQFDSFSCIGMYPTNEKWDMNYGKPEEDHPLKDVPLPKTDPIYGKEGPLLKLWTA